MTFEEWFYVYHTEKQMPLEEVEIAEEVTSAAWGCQQKRIDALEKKLKVTLETALRRGKILEQQFGYFDE